MLPNGSKKHTLFNNTQSSSNTSTNRVNNNDSNNRENQFNVINDDFVNLHINNNEKKSQLEDIQIKMIEDFLKTSKEQIKKINHTTEAEFQAFFDRHEFGITPGPANKLTQEDVQLLETQPSENNHELHYDQIPGKYKNHHVVSPKVIPKLEYHENLDVEDLLDEMTHKNFDRNLRAMQEYHLRRPINKEHRTPIASIAKDRCKTPKNVLDFNNDYNNIFEKILAENEIVRPNVDDKHFPKDKTNLTETLAENITENKFEGNNKKEQKALIEELVTKYDIKYLETVKKVDKVFAKSCNLKSNTEKCKLTLGPSLYEKSVVLPHIMLRLHQRDTASEAIKSMEMKLILDAAGPSTYKTTHVYKTSNTSQAIKGLVNLTFPSTPNLPGNPKDLNSSPRLLKSPEIARVKPNLTIPTKSYSPNNQKQTFLLQRPDNLSSTEQSQALDHEIPVLRPPELLMEDCNRNRLIAHRTRKLFESLVRKDFL